MKKLFLTMLLSLACLLGASAETLTVCDGTDRNSQIPIYGYYYDREGTISQVLYPASMLTEIQGKDIQNVTFYADAPIALTSGEQKVWVGEPNIDDLSGIVSDGLTNVFNGTMTYSNQEATITFEQPYNYTGGNLLISFQIVTAAESAPATYFYGINQNYDCGWSKTYSWSNGSAVQFLPKATFTYGTPADYAAKIDKESIDYGTSKLSELPKTQIVTLRNQGANAFTPSVTFSNSAFSTPYVASELAAAGSVDIPVVFQPSVAGNYEGTMTITAFEGEGGTFTVALTGNAYSGTVAPETIDFGTIPFNKINEIAPKTVTWTNYSGAPITPNVSATTPFDATWAAEVADGASVEIPVTFAPNAKGEYTGSLTIDAGTAGTYTVALTGVVGDNAYDITVCDGDATNVYVPINGNYFDTAGTISQVVYPSSELAAIAGMQISAITFYAKNDISFSGGKQNVSVAEVESTQMTGLVSTGLTSVFFNGTVDIDGKQVTINFNTPYQYNGGNLLISFEIAVGGIYKDTEFLGINPNYTSGWCNKNSYTPGQQFLPKATFVYQGELSEYKAIINKEAIDFGTSKLSELPKTETVTLRNLGTNAFTPSVAFSNDAFKTTYQPTELAAAGSVEIPVVFEPSATGDYEGTMTIDAGAAGTFTVALTGKAYGGAVVPESLDFGTTPFNQISNIEAKTVTLTNYSGETITPTVTATAPFGTTYEAAEVADGASVVIPVTFVPDAKGEFTGTLSINAGTAGNYTVALTGSVSDEVYNVTVCDGGDQNEYLPIHGINYDSNIHTSQMIFPAEMLTELKGHRITSLTFYPDRKITITKGQATVSLMETEQTTFESTALATGEFTDVATWVPSGADETLSLTFTKSYVYRGGNLMVQVNRTTDGSWQTIKFSGANQDSNVAVIVESPSSSSSNNRLVKFLPKATFGYDPEQVVVYDIEMTPAGGTFKGLQNVKANVTPEMPEGGSIKYIFAETDATDTPVEKDYPAGGVDVIKSGTLTFILQDANNEELARTSGEFIITPLIGDVNGDGKVDVGDVNYVVNIILGKIHPND